MSRIKWTTISRMTPMITTPAKMSGFGVVRESQ
jgi:hypothetical protein